MERHRPFIIVEGDEVEVSFGLDTICGIVRSKPCQPTDCWIIETPRQVYYVQQFNFIARVKAAQPGGEG